MTRTPSTTARLTALETKVDALTESISAFLATQVAAQAELPARVTRPKAAKPAAPKAPKAPKAPAKTVCLTRKTRAAFVAKAPWAKGLSTHVIAAMCVEDASLVPAGFAIGAGYAGLYA